MTSGPVVRPAGADHAATGRARRVIPPLLLGGLAVAATAVLQRSFDPFTQHVPLCLLHALTGLDCPGCGATRAVHALLRGDVLLALRCNALLFVLLPLAAAAWARWLGRTWRGEDGPSSRSRLPGRAAMISIVAVVLAFGVLRNLPAFWFLAPPAGV